MKEEELINKYEMFIYKMAKKFYNVELADLYQAGCIGLIKASRKFDETLGVNFMTFAYKYVFGEMYELTNKSRDIKINKYYLKILKEIEITKNELIQKLNKIPSLTEICLYAELDETLVSEVMLLTGSMLSLDDEYQTLNGDVKIADLIGTNQNIDDQILINDSLETLEPLEQSIMDYRYFKDLSQMETANILGISQVKVSRLESKSKKKLKEYIRA
ncbi:MAG: sigma-70 family RNA polymerase sigma factor [Bacilli bacterium]|nr:sigma-70 family RNA polymerase sigma factor [Bacilli bacterium]